MATQYRKAARVHPASACTTRTVIISLIVCTGPMFLLQAQTWDDGALLNDEWSNAYNWKPNKTPANNGTASLKFNLLLGTISEVDVPFDISSIEFSGSLATHTVYGQTLTIRDTVHYKTAGLGATFNNDILLNTSTTWDLSANSEIYVNGSLDGTGGLAKEGDGKLVINGGGSFSGTVTITGGTILLGDNEQFGDSANLVLDGGTLDLNGYDETMATLTLSDNSTIDFGPGHHSTLSFDSATYVSGQVSISNWTQHSGHSDTLILSSAPTQDLLDNIYWADLGILGAKWDSNTGVVTPVPEAETWCTAFALVVFIGGWHLHHKRSKQQEGSRRIHSRPFVV